MKRPIALLASAVLALLLVPGCASGGDPAPTGMTVTGKLLMPDGRAAGNREILVGGQKVTTDASGGFEATNVVSPYSLALYLEAFNYAVIYQGLTTEEPVLVAPILRPEEDRALQLTYQPYGHMAAPTPLTGTYSLSYVVCGGGALDMRGCTGPGRMEDAPTPRSVTWTGNPNQQVRIAAVQGLASSAEQGRFTHYSRFAFRNLVDLEDGADKTVDLYFGAVGNGTMSGVVTPPAGFDITWRSLAFVAGDERLGAFSYENGRTTPLPAAFSLATPVVTELGLSLHAEAGRGDSFVETWVHGLDPNATDVALTLPAPPQLIRPPNNALGLTENSTFEWAPFEDAVYYLTVAPATAGELGYILFTDATEVTLPDLSGLGLSLPRGHDYQWQVIAVGPIASANELAQGVYFENLLSTRAASDIRSGVTAP